MGSEEDRRNWDTDTRETETIKGKSEKKLKRGIRTKRKMKIQCEGEKIRKRDSPM
jgi:hypothetical protein